MTYTFDQLQLAALKVKLAYTGFAYQIGWYKSQSRIRHITKTRMCGADWYFALEALIDAIETGRNQNFLAPTLDGVLAWSRSRIVDFAKEVGVDIKDTNSPIYLDNGAVIRFFDENSYLSGFYGNAYVSEYAWSEHAARLFNFGRSLSANAKHRFTAYTTPSLNSEARALWLKEHPDYRQVLTAEDAILQGCTLLDLSEVKSLFTQQDFNMLFMGQWPVKTLQVTA